MISGIFRTNRALRRNCPARLRVALRYRGYQLRQTNGLFAPTVRGLLSFSISTENAPSSATRICYRVIVKECRRVVFRVFIVMEAR